MVRTAFFTSFVLVFAFGLLPALMLLGSWGLSGTLVGLAGQDGGDLLRRVHGLRRLPVSHVIWIRAGLPFLFLRYDQSPWGVYIFIASWIPSSGCRHLLNASARLKGTFLLFYLRHTVALTRLIAVAVPVRGVFKALPWRPRSLWDTDIGTPLLWSRWSVLAASTWTMLIQIFGFLHRVMIFLPVSFQSLLPLRGFRVWLAAGWRPAAVTIMWPGPTVTSAPWTAVWATVGPASGGPAGWTSWFLGRSVNFRPPQPRLGCDCCLRFVCDAICRRAGGGNVICYFSFNLLNMDVGGFPGLLTRFPPGGWRAVTQWDHRDILRRRGSRESQERGHCLV